jgi:periplasmic protein TonB
MKYITLLILVTLSGQTIQVFGQSISHASDSCELKYDSALSRYYYTTVDIMPTFKGGSKALIKTINKNLKWPGGRCDIEGTVFVACIIESDGQLTNKRILRGLSEKPCDTDGEALKVVDYLTTWVPGKCDGKNVPVQYVIPVKFKMR